ncbi:3-deoxy-7-phosphoheptulonate synthase [Granulicatella seriolae]|uniref:3-deoxy-7-phosphoheptulonate synthase n=1 Tax=Granulicatella seriolae TaxID=2967226 RepID=A0ABT1WNR0_9LACT|nr:3-deoxy-7-phosphoheptulonate synthase [Granulicatella seriolae]
MIILLKKNATASQEEELIERIVEMGLETHISHGKERTIIGLVGNTNAISMDSILKYPMVDDVKRIAEPYKKANRQFHEEDSIISVGGLPVGGDNFMVCAGPCSVEDEDLMIETAIRVKAAGANMLRGGAFKPRTSPYSFQGLGVEGLKRLQKAKEVTGLPIVSELMSEEFLDEFVERVDLIQIGARNMQNFSLLKELGKTQTPILLKRGLSSTYEEWLMSAEYIMAGGNNNVILCERGIRTYETATRNTFDIQAVPVIQKKSHLPIVMDPSHAAGTRYIVPSMSKASVMAGANGLILEVHPQPEKAWSDGQQTLSLDEFEDLMVVVKQLLAIEGKIIPSL